MRTLTDLQGAFALLERVADTQVDTSARTAGMPAELVRPPVRPTRHRRPWVLPAMAGAAAATIALAAAWFATGLHGAPDAGGPAPDAYLGPPPVTANVTFDPHLKLQLLAVTADATVAELDFFDRETWVAVNLIPDGAATRLSPGLQTVQVNGHVAYYADGTRPDFVEPKRNTATEPPPTPAAPGWARSIVWKYSADSWVRVMVQSEIGTESQLLRLARALRFGAPQPFRSAFSLAPHPAGLQLAAIDSTYHESGGNAPYALAGKDWHTLVDYAIAGSGADVAVEATSVDLSRDWHGGRAVTIGGRSAYWSPNPRRLDVRAGDGSFYDVRCDRVSFARCAAIARAVRVTPYALTPSRWFPAATALK